jgi:hypothetical protein
MAKKAPVAPKAKAHTAKKVYETPAEAPLRNILKVRTKNGKVFTVNRDYYETYSKDLTIVNDA